MTGSHRSPGSAGGGQASDPLTATPGLPAGLAMVALDHIHPSPTQPRVNVSVDMVQRLAASMRAGRHDPLLEVEPSPAMSGHYQIVCGEQRWRAAREAGISDVLVRLHPPLGYLERLLKQHEENHLRSDLDPVEDAGLVLLAKSLTDIAAAERILNDAAVPFESLDGKRITDRGQIEIHLAELKDMLVCNGLRVGLSPWRETERALGLSEASRKAKLAVLRLEPDILEEVRGLPAHHASLVARVADPKRRAELVARAPQLSNRQLHAAIRRLRADDDLEVADALDGIGPGNASGPDDPLRLEAQLTTLVDLCRQVLRILANLRQRVAAEERQRVADVLRAVASASEEFGP
jgi:ParB-like nuclease domain